MGVALSRKTVDFEIVVKTGDVKGAGTDSNVYCILIDCHGNQSRDILLDVTWRNDFEKGSIDKFKVRNVSELDQVEEIILWRDEKGIGDDWFVEYIKVIQNTVKSINNKQMTDDNLNNNDDNTTSANNNNNSITTDGNLATVPGQNETKVENISTNKCNEIMKGPIPFPCNRWIHPNKQYKLLKYDSLLPQFDRRQEQRKFELDDKKKKYKFGDGSNKTPRRVEVCPSEENFSNDYKWDIVGKKVRFLAQKKITKLLTSGYWESLGDLLDVYTGSFGVPYGYYNWRSDEKFGQQRLRGCNPTMLCLCKKIPENFPVTDEMLSPFMDGKEISEAIAAKDLYIVDLSVLKDICCKNERKICAPIALFYTNNNGDLMPIAIQLFQQPSDTNPIFVPSDPPYTWMLAKMYYNNAECCVHQTCTHLGFTHLVVESICVTVHQTLSPSHPVFRLLAPHFLYLIAINTLAVSKLLAPDGWIDVTMTMGVCGLYQILEKKWEYWRLDTDAWLPAELKSRGVDDTNALPGYMYRDDALLLHYAILNYVTEVLTDVYGTPEELMEDNEIQDFAALLSDNENGPGIKGVFGDGKFSCLDELVKTITATIFLSSVGHAAANFCQYDEYAFPPNYPATLKGEPPTCKTDVFTEKDILSHLPSKDTTLSIMVVTSILSDRGTNGLGDFEIQYQYNPEAVTAVERFRGELAKISESIKLRNAKSKEPYSYLDPEEIPNAISI